MATTDFAGLQAGFAICSNADGLAVFFWFSEAGTPAGDLLVADTSGLLRKRATFCALFMSAAGTMILAYFLVIAIYELSLLLNFAIDGLLEERPVLHLGGDAEVIEL
jgi:hypothetical protein